MINESDVVVGIGGAAGDGVASAGNTLALSVARQGQAVYAYNAYQSVIRGGHSWLRLRISAKKPLNHGDQVDALIARYDIARHFATSRELSVICTRVGGKRQRRTSVSGS